VNWSGSANDPGTTDSHRRHSLRRAMFFPCTGELREKQAATTHTGALHTRVARTHAAAQVSHQCYRRDKQGGVALVAAEVGKSAVGMRKRFEHFAGAFGFPRGSHKHERQRTVAGVLRCRTAVFCSSLHRNTLLTCMSNWLPP